MLYGYMGKMLFVNLSARTIEERPLSKLDAKNFLGGPGLGAKVLYDEMPAGTPVFSEDSMIGFVTGPLNNTGALYGGRYTVVCKSPVTGGWNDANSGGWFGQTLRQAGYDAVFVNGIAENPVYIFIDNGKVEIRSAEHIWGLTTRETEEVFKQECGEKMSAALIGPAGEGLSYIAAVMNDGHRAAARGGPGAVMGSKKLKAVVAVGSIETPVAEPEKIKSINAEIQKFIEEDEGDGGKHSRNFAEYGTGSRYEDTVICNDSGIKNWTGSVEDYSVEAAEAISSEGLKEKGYIKGKYCCASCSQACSAFIEFDTKSWGKLRSTRPEYETMAAFGGMLLNEDVEALCVANDLCNEYGLDTMSAGSVVAWAMECYNEGALSQNELEGIDLLWGNGIAIVELIHKIGKCEEGIGKILSKGTREAAKLLGKGAEYLVVANGIEEPQHDSRFFYGLGRTYLTDPTPGRHVKASIDGMTTEPGFDPEKSLRGTGFEDLMAAAHYELTNASGMCAFGLSCGNPNNAYVRNLLAATGFSYSGEGLISLGLRIFTMRHAFNLREGWRRDKLEMSERMRSAKPPFKGPIKNVSLDFEGMIDSFYDALGWTRDGIPAKRTLELIGGLDAVIEDIYGKQEESGEFKTPANTGAIGRNFDADTSSGFVRRFLY